MAPEALKACGKLEKGLGLLYNDQTPVNKGERRISMQPSRTLDASPSSDCISSAHWPIEAHPGVVGKAYDVRVILRGRHASS